MLSSPPKHFSKPTMILCKLRCSFYLKIHHKKLLWRYYFYKCGSFENKLDVAWFLLRMKIRLENLRKLWHSPVFTNQEFSASPQTYQDERPAKNIRFSIIKVTWERRRWNSSWWVFNTRKCKTAQAICRFNFTETNQCKQSLSRVFFLSLAQLVCFLENLFSLLNPVKLNIIRLQRAQTIPSGPNSPLL